MAENNDTYVMKFVADTKGANKEVSKLQEQLNTLVELQKTLQEFKLGTKFSTGGETSRFKIQEATKSVLQALVKASDKYADSIRNVDVNLKKQNATVEKYNKELEKVKKSSKETSVETGKLQEELEELGETTDKTKAKVSIFGQIWEELTGNIGKRIAIFASYKTISLITNALQDSAREVVDLQKEFANIQAITAAVDGTMQSLTSTIYEVGSNSKYSTQELAKTTVVLGQAGYSATEIEKLLESVSQLAAATGTDLATSVSVATSALTVWNLEATQMSRVSDVLTTAVNETKAEIGTIANGIQYAGAMFSDLGVSLEESVALFSAVTNAGLKARSVVGTGSRALVTELINPSEKLKKVLDRLGLTLNDIDIRSKGITLVLENLRNAGFGAEEAFESLDRRAATFYSAASSQIETIKQLNSEFLITGSTLKANETQMDTISAQTQRFKNIFIETTSRGVKPFLDTFTKLFTLFNDFLSTGVVKWFVSEFATFAVVWKTLNPLLIKGIGSFSSLKTVLTGTIASLSNLSLGFKKVSSGATASSVSIKKFQFSLVGLKKLLSSFSGALIVTGIIEAVMALINHMNKAEAELEKLENESASSKTKMDSVNAAYEDLINKSELYQKDSESLKLKIAQLNQQFEIMNGLLLDQSDNYGEVLDKMSKYRFELEKEQGLRYASQSKNRRSVATKGKIFSWFKDFEIGKDLYVSSRGKEFSDIGSWRKQYYDTVYSLSQEEAFAVQEEILKLKDSYMKSEKERIFVEARRAKLEDMKSKVAQLSSELGSKYAKENAEIIQLVSTSTKASEKYTDESLKTYVLPFEEVINNLDETKDSLKEKLQSSKQTLKDAIEKEPLLEKLPNEFVNMLRSQINTIEMALIDVENKTTEKLKAFVDGSLKSSREEYSNLLKVAQSGFYPTRQIQERLKKSESDLQIALQRKYDLELRQIDSKYKGKVEDPRYLLERNNLLKQYESEGLKSTSDLNKTIFKLNDTFEKLSGSVKQLNEEIKTLESDSETRKIKLKRDLGLSEREASLSSQIQYGNLSPLEETKQTIELEKLQHEYDKQSLLIEEETLSKLKAKKEIVDETLNSMKGEVDTLTSEINSLEKIDYNYAEWKDKSEKLNTRQRELTELMRTQRDLSEDIVDKENDLLIKRRQVEIAEASGGSKTAKKSYFGFSGGRDKYVDDIEEEFKQFNLLAQTSYNTLTNLETGFSNFFQNIADGSMNASKAFRNFVSDFIKSMLTFVSEMLAKAAVLAALQGIPGMKAILFGADAAATGANVAMLGNVSGLAGVNYSRHAAGGFVKGGTPNRDSVPSLLMPGEFVLKKSAVSALGSNFLNDLNNNTQSTMASLNGTTVVQQSEPSVVNVWVVADKNEAQIGPNDIIATISKDIRTGGTTKRLIQSVIAGRKA